LLSNFHQGCQNWLASWNGWRGNQDRAGKGLECVRAVIAAAILERIGEDAKWDEILNACQVVVTKFGSVEIPDWNIRFAAMKYLTDRRDGRPKEAVEVSDLVNGRKDFCGRWRVIASVWASCSGSIAASWHFWFSNDSLKALQAPTAASSEWSGAAGKCAPSPEATREISGYTVCQIASTSSGRNVR
jgi:hypothetical protein